MEKNIVTALCELRKKSANLKVKAKSFNQAVKALQGIMTDEEKELLGLTNGTGVKAVMEAWAPQLKLTVDGKQVVALYMNQPHTTLIEGEEHEVRLFERKETKKGVTFKALSVRRLAVPSAWSTDLVIEGLCQSMYPQDAAKEAQDTFAYIDTLDALYRKQSKKDEQGNITTTWEEVQEEA